VLRHLDPARPSGLRRPAGQQSGSSLLREFVDSKRQKAERWRTQRVLQAFLDWLKDRRMKDVRAVRGSSRRISGLAPDG
jgi:hypothetical protein